MFKYLLVVLIVWYQIQGYASAPSDTILPVLKSPNKHDGSENAEEVEKKYTIVINGNITYHVGHQQIFYLNDRYKEIDQRIKDENEPIKDNDKKSKQYLDGYIVTPDIGVHKLHTHTFSWNKARYICTQEGGNLAVINSDSEEKILLGILKDKNIDIAWLGLHDQFEEGDWLTINGVALENTGYTKWTTKWAPDTINPNNQGGNQNCATLIQPEGGMNDRECDAELSFVCEIPA